MRSYKYVQSILDPKNDELDRLLCPPLEISRYSHLKATVSDQGAIVRYFFALDLVDATAILPALMGAIIQAIKFLGPRHCALSIVVGESKDNTSEILELLREEIKDMKLEFHLTSSDIKPKESQDRIGGLPSRGEPPRYCRLAQRPSVRDLRSDWPE